MTTYLGACVDTAGTAVWQIRNRHGDVVGTVDGAAHYTANPTADEFGVGTTPSSRLGYLGSYQRFTADASLGLIRMGVRLYDPTLGRFLQADPVRGGAANAYDYAFQDPVNGLDPAGDISLCSSDFCPAAIAQIQGSDSNWHSPLQQSETWYIVNQNQRQNSIIDRESDQIAPVSVKHDGLKALAQTGEVVALGTAVAVTGGYTLGAAPADIGMLSSAGNVASFGGTLFTCLDKGVGPSCARNGALTFGTSILGPLAANEHVTQAAKVAISALGAVADFFGF